MSLHTCFDKSTFWFAFSRILCLQGIDALGVATLSSATSAAASRLPFADGPSPLTSLDDEDVTNLRNLYRLLLLLSKVSQKENSSPVCTIFNRSQLSAFFIHLCGNGKKLRLDMHVIYQKHTYIMLWIINTCPHWHELNDFVHRIARFITFALSLCLFCSLCISFVDSWK